MVILYRMTLYYNIGMNYCMYIKQIRDVVYKTQSKAIQDNKNCNNVS